MNDPNALGAGDADAGPAAEALLRLLLYMAAADGQAHADELQLIARAYPQYDAPTLLAMAAENGAPSEMDLLAIADTMHTPDERWKCLRFAARMAWRDGRLDPGERVMLNDLAIALALPGGAVDRVLREMKADGTRFAPDRILQTVRDVGWDTAHFASGALASADLAAVCPPGVTVVARIGLDRVEVAALCAEGILGRFREGPAFVPWGDLVSYSRDQALDASLVLHTEDGHDVAFVDGRMSGLALILDRLIDNAERKKSAPPKIERLRGG